MKILTANDHRISFCRGTANGDRHQDKHILSGLANGAKIPVARARQHEFVGSRNYAELFAGYKVADRLRNDSFKKQWFVKQRSRLIRRLFV